MKVFEVTRRSALALIASVAVAAPVSAQAVEETYDGRTVTILIGHPPGGSYDLYAQLAAEFMGQYIPGAPNVVVQHMPGGGGRKGAAFFLNNTDPDGLTVAILPDSLGHIQFLRPDAASWDASKIRYIGRFAPANAVFAVRKGAPATTIDGMRENEIVVACTGKNARSAQQAAAMGNLAGLNLRLICGYKGSKATVLAALSGEADMLSQNWASFKSQPDPIDSGDLIMVVQTGLERDPDLPDVPLMQELTEDPEAQSILRFMGASAPIGRSMMVHPDTPAPLIGALRDAFQKMMADPAFLAEAEKRKAIILPASGEDMEAIMQEIMSATPDFIDKVKVAIDTTGAGAVQ